MRKAFILQLRLVIFCDFLIVEEILFSPQVKRSVVISNKLVYMRYLTRC